MRLSDIKGKHSISGPEGSRLGIDIHCYSPHFAQGCLTTGGNTSESEDDFIDLLPSLTNGEDVRIIIEWRDAAWNEENDRWEGVDNRNTDSDSNAEESQKDYSSWWEGFILWANEWINSDDEE